MSRPPLANPAMLRSALELAQTGRFEEAQAMASWLEKGALSTDELRKLALVYAYCGGDLDAEEVWAAVCTRDDVGPADCFMLASVQVALGRFDQAIRNFWREFSAARREGRRVCQDVSGINLAHFLAASGDKTQALQVLGQIDGSQSAYVPGVGFLTKQELLLSLVARRR